MTVKVATYGVCKYIQSLPDRATIRTAIEALNVAHPADMAQMISPMGYYGRSQRAQFYGYLAVDKTLRESKDDRASLARPLSPEFLELLRIAHGSMIAIVEECMNAIKGLPDRLAKLLNPYYGKSTVMVGEPANIIEKGHESIKALSVAFSEHRAIAAADDARKAIAAMDAGAIGMVYGAVDGLERGLLENRKGKCSELLELRIGRREDDSVEMSRALGCIMGLRLSLKNIVELCYQAFWQDKLVLLDTENIYSFSAGQDTVGKSATLKIQPVGRREEFTEPGEMVMMKMTLKDMDVDELCLVFSNNLRFDQETGVRLEYAVECVDEDLNQYPGAIWRKAERLGEKRAEITLTEKDVLSIEEERK